MGLSIKRYSHSYSTLHKLRQLALDCENIKMSIMAFYDEMPFVHTKFAEFINHSDCEGIYISKKSKQYEKFKRQAIKAYGIENYKLYFGDLDKLKLEVEILNEYVNKNDISLHLKEAWDAFYKDIKYSRKIIEFI